jgi:major membrane immunogen (membrane-anchored lipoprotein)
MSDQSQSNKPLMYSVDEWKDRWIAFVALFIWSTYDNVGECVVVDNTHVSINGTTYKVDINDYTGAEDKYIFVNLHNGRLVLCNGEKQSVKRIEFI